MLVPIEPELEALVHQPFAIEPVRQPGLAEEVDGALLEQAGPHPLLDVLPAAPLDHDGVHALQGEQVREQETTRARSDDHHLGAQSAHVSSCLQIAYSSIRRLRRPITVDLVAAPASTQHG